MWQSLGFGFFFSSRRRHTRCGRDWSSDVCSSDLCADNTDTYAWVSNGAHDKLYLIMDFYPLHEPGQGNQGLRACNGYRYEFHIGKGASLKDEVVYRIEFTNRSEERRVGKECRSRW